MIDPRRALFRAGLMVAASFMASLMLAGCLGGEAPTRTLGDRQVPPTAPGGDYYPGETLSDRDFYVHDLGHRCLDFGGQDSWALGAPVFIYSCNGTVAQQVRVKEIDNSHDVELTVQSGDFCIGVRGGEVRLGRALELQMCDPAGSRAQRFALDGDAILMGGQPSGRVTRDYVIEPERDYTPNRTPLVVGTRELSDAEYFRFEAVDSSQKPPTTGFVRVWSEIWLDWALTLGWGTVIEIDDRQPPLELHGPFPKEVPAGVTVRGYRKHTNQGPEIRTCAYIPAKADLSRAASAFYIAQDHVRLTGLRLRGPRTDPRCGRQNPTEFDGDEDEAPAIRIHPSATMSIWIDHLDVSYWYGHAIDVRAETDSVLNQDCLVPRRWRRRASVRAIANFLHHNWGYGVVTGSGAFVLARENVMYGQKAHSIASDGVRTSGYQAYDNLMLIALITNHKPHDFDAHGSLDPGHWEGGTSGDYFDIGWNTFLPADGRLNFYQRGTPCRFTSIHDNVFRQSKTAAIKTKSEDLSKHRVSTTNTFNATPHPLSDLAVADFDGDGLDDVFVGTGAAWYFSSGGQAEWRFLNRMPEHASSLRFGDFDRDGRADIVALHGAHIDVSWGGISPWETVNVTAWKVSDLAVGDFDGDGRADLFLATGTRWFYAPGGRNWTPLHFSRYRTSELRFGDFKHMGRTQALRVFGGQWQTAGLGVSWNSIGSAPVRSTAGLVVADFDGDGFDDVGRTNPMLGRWEYSSPGRTTVWWNLRQDSRPLLSQPIGRFDSDHTDDVILWKGLRFDYAPSGRDPVQRLSRQNMD
jgi:hypothetical protein